MLVPALVLAQKNPTETQRLATLAKTWGLLKYHNPNIACGALNRGIVLVAHVPDLRKAITSKDHNKAVQALIVAAGPKAHKAADMPDTSTLFMENYDVDWTCNVQLFNTGLYNARA